MMEGITFGKLKETMHFFGDDQVINIRVGEETKVATSIAIDKVKDEDGNTTGVIVVFE